MPSHLLWLNVSGFIQFLAKTTLKPLLSFGKVVCNFMSIPLLFFRKFRLHITSIQIHQGICMYMWYWFVMCAWCHTIFSICNVEEKTGSLFIISRIQVNVYNTSWWVIQTRIKNFCKTIFSLCNNWDDGGGGCSGSAIAFVVHSPKNELFNW